MDRTSVPHHADPGDHIGRSLHRPRGQEVLIGLARYVDEIAVPGQMHGVVLRSSHGYAWIEGIDAAAAHAMPGVSGVFTAADLDADGIGTLPCPSPRWRRSRR